MIKERSFLQKEIVLSLEDVDRLKGKNKSLKSKVKKVFFITLVLYTYITYILLLVISIKINNFFLEKK